MPFSSRLLNSALLRSFALGLVGCALVAAPTLAQNKQAETPAAAASKEAGKDTSKDAAKDKAAAPAAQPAAKAEDSDDKAATTAVGIAQAPWSKVCGRAPGAEKDTCLTGQEVRSDQGAFLSSVAVEELQGDAKKTIRVAVPVGLLIQPGLIVRVDDQKGFPARFTVCLPNACFASLETAAEVVASMKKGKNLLIAGRNMQGKEINISMPLTSFATAYDGAPLDTKALEEQQKKLQDSMQKKAEEERKKLLDKPADKK